MAKKSTNLFWNALSCLSIHWLSCLKIDSIPPALLFLIPVLVLTWARLLPFILLLTVAVVEHFSSCSEVNVLPPQDVNQVNVLQKHIATIEKWSCAEEKLL